MNMKYEELIDKFNNNEILEFYFSVANFSHYNNCLIKAGYDKLPNGKQIYCIMCKMTRDSSELVTFLYHFNEAYKLFKLKNKGSFTLKQMWGQIIIKKIL